MESPVSCRRPCFVEDDGLASIAGFSGININNNHYCVHSCLKNHQILGHKNGVAPLMLRRSSLRNMASLSSPASSSCSSSVFSPRSGRLFDRCEEAHSPHFLEACFLCKKPLGKNRDIFMYRGDTPFCSEECRQEQIDIDEAKEKNRKLKALRSKKESSKTASSSSSSPAKTQKYPIRTGAVAAA